MKPKERILETSSRLFHKQGYNSTGINQIIEEAGVAKASFYKHFKSKEDLCVAFLDNRHEYWFKSLLNFTEKVNPALKIAKSFDFISHMNEKEGFRGCSFLNILSEIPQNNTKIIKIIQNHKRELQQYFLSITPTVELADHIYLLFESALVESQVFRSQKPVKIAKKIIKPLI